MHKQEPSKEYMRQKLKWMRLKGRQRIQQLLQREEERRASNNSGRYAARNTAIKNKCLVITEKVTRQAFCFD